MNFFLTDSTEPKRNMMKNTYQKKEKKEKKKKKNFQVHWNFNGFTENNHIKFMHYNSIFSINSRISTPKPVLSKNHSSIKANNL